jgi:two-component system, NarL family, nitrate/nitrite response regulator NarL
MSEPLRIIIIDDHPLFRQGVVQTLTTEPGFQIVGQGENGAQALSLTCELLPDILLLDIGIPGGGIQTARSIADACPAIKIVMLTVSEDEDNLTEALRVGARAYILKGVSAHELTEILNAVAGGEVYVTPSLANSLLLENPSPGVGTELQTNLMQLTRREYQILEQVATGASNKEIANLLFLSEKTVKHYMTNILQKLQVRNRVEAALIAHRARITKI